ncbi:MAG: hypothetical protein JJE16_14225, partial [Nitrospiraceae bacterium]|nr:hypothetical protein [Nitrospiraceae bacterium]
GAVLHLYGKRAIRPRRKMGHVTFLGETLGLALDRAKQFQRTMRDHLRRS